MNAFDPTPLRPDAQTFPNPVSHSPLGQEVTSYPGLTARQHAAIALRVPDSGTEWLDVMIRASLRDQLASRAMTIILERDDIGITAYYPDDQMYEDSDEPASNLWATQSYQIADAMMEARDTVMGKVTR